MAKAKSPPSPGVSKRFELLTLGNELLLGLTANGHLTFIGEQLGRRGVELGCNIVISDCCRAIAQQLARSWARSDVVITTGGLGPTSDDRTREAVAEVLGQKLVLDPAIEKSIADRFARIGRRMTPNNLKQAYRPEKSEAIANPFGTAPGLWVEQDGKVLIMLPGPPNELQPMWNEQVLPRLIQRGLVGEHETYVQMRTAGIGESVLETKLEPLLKEHPGLQVAYCAHQWAVDVRFGASPEVSLTKVEKIATSAAALLGDDFVCFGGDSLGRVVSDLLRRQEKTLAVAESGTGGLLSNCFADLPGASKFFAGGVICYGNEAKVQLLDIPECLLVQHGAVSAECAVAIANGVAERLGTDFGLGITGWAGPGSGTNEYAGGSIFIGLHAPDGIWCKKLDYPGTRQAVKARAVNAALDWLRRELLRAQRAVPVKRSRQRAAVTAR